MSLDEYLSSFDKSKILKLTAISKIVDEKSILEITIKPKGIFSKKSVFIGPYENQEQTKEGCLKTLEYCKDQKISYKLQVEVPQEADKNNIKEIINE